MNSPSESRASLDKTPPVPGRLVYRRDQSKYCKKLIVAVHGMGDQMRNDIAQNVAELFAQHYAKSAGLETQAVRLPLGLWDAGGEVAEDHASGFVPLDKDNWLNPFAFAEAYWAQIPRKLDDEGYRLEEAKHWAASVVQRLCQRHDVVREFGTEGPQVAATVVEEIAETLRLMDRILWVAQKAGILEVNAVAILNKYLGDVQQVADFRGQRRLIREQFVQRMRWLANNTGEADIHIIAHSEGTVVAYLGMLDAMRRDETSTDENPDLCWIRRVRSFTTMGSPIDKHLILWPEMWYRYSRPGTTWLKLDKAIRWRNYYDLADPVGFELETARLQLGAWKCEAFDFKPEHDHGFRRYPLPGKAHVDYLGDVELFGHIIDDAVENRGNRVPKDTRLGKMSGFITFFIVALVHVAAVFIFHKALVGSLPDNACHTNSAIRLLGDAGFSKFMAVLVRDTFGVGAWGIVGCTAILLGTTVFSRVCRITREVSARRKALGAYVAGIVLYWFFPGCYSMEVAGRVWALLGQQAPSLVMARLFFIALSVVVIVVARAVDEKSLQKKNPPIWGMRWTMILIGLILMPLLVWPRLADTAVNQEPGTLLLSSAAFFYLWWIGMLLFDLTFVWKAYINTSRTIMDKVREVIKPPPAGAQVVPE